MYYYNVNGCLIASVSPFLEADPITEEEYNRLIEEELKQQEEDIKAEKEAQLQALLKELYPQQEKEILDNLEQTN